LEVEPEVSAVMQCFHCAPKFMYVLKKPWMSSWTVVQVLAG